MSKGCGCQSGIFKWFKPPYAKLFYAACCIHDDDYDRGGSESDRKAADVRLFVNCFRKIGKCMQESAVQNSFYQCRTQKHSPIGKCSFAPAKALWVAVIALCYYWSVRLLGSNYFNYHP